MLAVKAVRSRPGGSAAVKSCSPASRRSDGDDQTPTSWRSTVERTNVATSEFAKPRLNTPSAAIHDSDACPFSSTSQLSVRCSCGQWVG